MIKNDKGLTLLELLAAITITGFILAVAILLLSSVNHLWNNTSQKYNDDASMELVMNTITKHLTASSQLIYFSHNELRFKEGQVYKSLYFSDKTLTLFDYSDTGDSAVDSANFKDPSVNPVNNPSLYTNSTILSKMVSSLSLTYNGSYLTAESLVRNGSVINIAVTFDYTAISAAGARSVVPKTKSTSIKLMKDY